MGLPKVAKWLFFDLFKSASSDPCNCLESGFNPDFNFNSMSVKI